MLLENIDLNRIQDIGQAWQAIVMLFNLVEDMKLENRKLQKEIRHLRDENNRLEGK